MNANQKDALVLVTGGTGLVGSYLIRYLLQEGYTKIRAICRPSSRFDLLGADKEKVEWKIADVLDVYGLDEAMADVRQVYHCAAIISFKPKERGKMLQVNQEGTANVVNACLYHGVEKLVHVSSIASIGRNKKKPQIDEQTKWQRSPDNSHYAISKFQAEQEVWRGQAEGLKVAVVNPSVILGGGFWDSGPLKVFGAVWRKFPFYPIGSTGFVDVRDVVRFMVRLMESNIIGERYILNGTNTSYQSLQFTIAKSFNLQPPSYALSPRLARWTARLDWLWSKFTGKEPLLTRESVRLTSQSYKYLNDKSRNDFDFEYLPLSQTVQETAELFVKAAADDFKPMTLALT